MEWLISFLEYKIFYTVVGMIGVALYVASYTALQFGKLDGNSIQYCLCNGGAASLVLVSLYHDFNLASATIQIVWISVSGYGLFKHWQKHKQRPLKKEELMHPVHSPHYRNNRRLRVRRRSSSIGRSI